MTQVNNDKKVTRPMAVGRTSESGQIKIAATSFAGRRAKTNGKHQSFQQKENAVIGKRQDTSVTRQTVTGRTSASGRLKIFATGFARRRSKANGRHQTFHQSDIFEHVVSVLEHDLGHVVTKGGWDLGDPIPDADLYLVDVLSPESRTTSKHALPMLDLMSHNVPLLLIHSDHQIGPSLSGFRGLGRHPERLVNKTVSGYFLNRDNTLIDVNLVRERFDPMHAVLLDYVTDWPRNWTTIIPLVRFARPAILMRYFPGAGPNQLRAYDPSPAVDRLIPHRLADHRSRSRCWIVATLTNPSNWLDRQRLQWPIQGYGRWAKNRVHEDVVVEAHRACWGSISVPHPGHAGSGWQRARHVIAAKSGAVTLLDPRDRMLFGPPYQYSAREYESMSDAKLARVAAAQYEWLVANTATYPEFVRQVERAVEAALWGMEEV